MVIANSGPRPWRSPRAIPTSMTAVGRHCQRRPRDPFTSTGVASRAPPGVDFADDEDAVPEQGAVQRRAVPPAVQAFRRRRGSIAAEAVRGIQVEAVTTPGPRRDRLHTDVGLASREPPDREHRIGPQRQGRQPPALRVEVVQGQRPDTGEPPVGRAPVTHRRQRRLHADVGVADNAIRELEEGRLNPPAALLALEAVGDQQLERVALHGVRILHPRRPVVVEVAIVDLGARWDRDRDRDGKYTRGASPSGKRGLHGDSSPSSQGQIRAGLRREHTTSLERPQAWGGGESGGARYDARGDVADRNPT